MQLSQESEIQPTNKEIFTDKYWGEFAQKPETSIIPKPELEQIYARYLAIENLESIIAATVSSVLINWNEGQQINIPEVFDGFKSSKGVFLPGSAFLFDVEQMLSVDSNQLDSTNIESSELLSYKGVLEHRLNMSPRELIYLKNRESISKGTSLVAGNVSFSRIIKNESDGQLKIWEYKRQSWFATVLITNGVPRLSEVGNVFTSDKQTQSSFGKKFRVPDILINALVGSTHLLSSARATDGKCYSRVRSIEVINPVKPEILKPTKRLRLPKAVLLGKNKP